MDSRDQALKDRKPLLAETENLPKDLEETLPETASLDVNATRDKQRVNNANQKREHHAAKAGA